MRIKTFHGRSLDELLPQIRAELGPNAVVIGQRAKVEGGIAGFFGTKMVEVTAADSMPSDDDLVDLEAQLMDDGERGSDDADARGHDDADDLAARFATAMETAQGGGMNMGRRSSIDVRDDWNPADDADLAEQYGRVLEHAASAHFSELDVPVVEPSPRAAAPAAEPLEQARELSARAHERVQRAAASVDQTYAPPRAMPRANPAANHTFAAAVVDTPMQSFDSAGVGEGRAPADEVALALRTDLEGPTTTLEPEQAAPVTAPLAPAAPAAAEPLEFVDALANAVDILDLKAMAALRSAVHATRRSQERSDVDHAVRHAHETHDAAIRPVTSALREAGVDDDVVDSLVDTALRHRAPFLVAPDIAHILRSLVEESIDVRCGAPRTSTRAHTVAFVGAANAGKTTAIAKIARGYATLGMRVAVLSIIAAEPGVSLVNDPVLRDADVDVRYAATSQQAAEAMFELEDADLVLIDTPSATYLDTSVFAQVQECLSAVGADEVNVVLPMATSAREARSIVDAFRVLGANRLLVSRIDESRYVGEILNLCFRLRLPMTFLSEGTVADGTLRAASARDVATLILGPETHDEHSAR